MALNLDATTSRILQGALNEAFPDAHVQQHDLDAAALALHRFKAIDLRRTTGDQQRGLSQSSAPRRLSNRDAERELGQPLTRDARSLSCGASGTSGCR